MGIISDLTTITPRDRIAQLAGLLDDAECIQAIAFLESLVYGPPDAAEEISAEDPSMDDPGDEAGLASELSPGLDDGDGGDDCETGVTPPQTW